MKSKRMATVWRKIYRELEYDGFVCNAADELHYLRKISRAEWEAVQKAVAIERKRQHKSKFETEGIGLWPIGSQKRIDWVKRQIEANR